MQRPEGIAAIAGWTGAAFLMGIAAHSAWPYASVPMGWLALAASVCVALIVSAAKFPWLRLIGIVGLALLLGVWRFDIARPTLPRGLVPFSSKGLAYASGNVIGGPLSDVQSRLTRVRSRLTDRAKMIFPPEEAALLTGVLYGDRGLSKPVKDQFRRAGLLHIIAVSGSNVTVVTMLVMSFLLALGASRRLAFGVLSVALLFFVLFVSPSASVMRAAVMGWLVALAPIVGRIPRPSRLLLISAVVFVAWQPWALFYDAGFALSFLCMWGLLTWSRFFAERLDAHSPFENANKMLADSASAVLMTAPYTAWAFGQWSLYGLVTSLVALPLVPWIMATGSLALLIPQGTVLALPARGFLKTLLWIGRWPDMWPVGYWSHITLSFFGMAALYVAIFWTWQHVKRSSSVDKGSVDSPTAALSDPSLLSEDADKMESLQREG